MNDHAKAFQICTPRSAMLRGEAGLERDLRRSTCGMRDRQSNVRLQGDPGQVRRPTMAQRTGCAAPRWKQAQC